MNPLEFLNSKKVWRPNFKNSLPIIDVVTNNRPKVHPKEEYSLKVNNIEMHQANFACVENFTKISTIHEKSNHYIEWSKHQRTSDTGKNKNENYVISTVKRHVKNEITFKEQSPKQIITVKKEKKIARKVYLKWSKYTSSYQGDKNDIILDLGLINRRNFLLKKYWNLWRKHVRENSIKPELNLTCKNTRKIINRGNSEDNLICSTKTTKPIQKRNSEHNMVKNKAYKSLLDMQKQKIEEQANVIKELQLAQIKLEEEKTSAERQLYLKDTSEKCDQKLKSKAKFLSMCNLPAKVDTAKYKNSWEFVTKMEVRAEERKKKWDIIKERKQKLEEERQEKLRLEEERKRKVEEEEKKKKILQIKLEKQRQEEMRKKQEVERLHLNALNLKAVEHYNNQLIRSTFDAFKHLINVKNFMMKEAERYYDEKILLYYFTIWKLFYKIQLQRKQEKAEDFYTMLLLERGFSCFKQMHKQYVSNFQVAADFNDFTIQRNYFYQWQVFVYVQKHEMNKKEAMAENFYQNTLMQRCLQSWKKLPTTLFQEREREQRIRVWYNKVQELLPDFQSSSECIL